MPKWHYIGDVNLERGGYFFNFEDWEHGYVNCVEVCDLDSGCGFRGAVAIEEKTIHGISDEEKIDAALSCIGANLLENGAINDNGRIIEKTSRKDYRMCIAYALVSYGYYDQKRYDVLQLERDEPLHFDGWSAEPYYGKSLRRYVRREFNVTT